MVWGRLRRPGSPPRLVEGSLAPSLLIVDFAPNSCRPVSPARHVELALAEARLRRPDPLPGV